MDCLGPRCAAQVLAWLQAWAASGGQVEPVEAGGGDVDASAAPTPVQGSLFAVVPYREEAPAIRSSAEMDGAIEHLDYAVFRRYQNQLTRAERARLDNTIENALFKAERYLAQAGEEGRRAWGSKLRELQERVHGGRERVERQRDQARRAELKLAQLGSLTPEGFEEFVAELFEALGYEVDRVGGTGDEGADLRVSRGGLCGVVQCKYFSRGVVGSPDLQKFLGTIHHTRCHKGFFVTTRTFTLAAEKFAADHPIELIDGPRLVELVSEALGPAAKRPPEPTLF